MPFLLIENFDRKFWMPKQPSQFWESVKIGFVLCGCNLRVGFGQENGEQNCYAVPSMASWMLLEVPLDRKWWGSPVIKQGKDRFGQKMQSKVRAWFCLLWVLEVLLFLAVQVGWCFCFMLLQVLNSLCHFVEMPRISMDEWMEFLVCAASFKMVLGWWKSNARLGNFEVLDWFGKCQKQGG